MNTYEASAWVINLHTNETWNWNADSFVSVPIFEMIIDKLGAIVMVSPKSM